MRDSCWSPLQRTLFKLFTNQTRNLHSWAKIFAGTWKIFFLSNICFTLLRPLFPLVWLFDKRMEPTDDEKYGRLRFYTRNQRWMINSCSRNDGLGIIPFIIETGTCTQKRHTQIERDACAEFSCLFPNFYVTRCRRAISSHGGRGGGGGKGPFFFKLPRETSYKMRMAGIRSNIKSMGAVH